MKLNKGDTIGIISLAGKCDRNKIEKSKSYFESLGYKVKLSKIIFDNERYLAGSDENKVNALHDFFTDKEIKLILVARGGYGSIRIINQINYDIIKNNQKIFCGYSDITALLLMIYKKTGIITYHSPMAQGDFDLESGEKTFTTKSFFDVINQKINCFQTDFIYNPGYAEGILWGGNLSTVVSLCGQDFIPDKDFIFFAEDLNEPVYKIDKMFTQLLNIKDFKQKCKGIILGNFIDVDNKEWLSELFEEIANYLNIPTYVNYKISHSADKITLPVGQNAILQNDKLILKD